MKHLVTLPDFQYNLVGFELQTVDIYQIIKED